VSTVGGEEFDLPTDAASQETADVNSESGM